MVLSVKFFLLLPKFSRSWVELKILIYHLSWDERPRDSLGSYYRKLIRLPLTIALEPWGSKYVIWHKMSGQGSPNPYIWTSVSLLHTITYEQWHCPHKKKKSDPFQSICCNNLVPKTGICLSIPACKPSIPVFFSSLSPTETSDLTSITNKVTS